MALSTARIITPTSAKIASHILAMPTAERMRIIALTARENTMFSNTIAIVFLAMRLANETGSLVRESTICPLIVYCSLTIFCANRKGEDAQSALANKIVFAVPLHLAE